MNRRAFFVRCKNMVLAAGLLAVAPKAMAHDPVIVPLVPDDSYLTSSTDWYVSDFGNNITFRNNVLYGNWTHHTSTLGSYFVGPRGSDANIGTFVYPFRTLDGARAVAKAGDTIIVLPTP